MKRGRVELKKIPDKTQKGIKKPDQKQLQGKEVEDTSMLQTYINVYENAAKNCAQRISQMQGEQEEWKEKKTIY